MAVSPIEKRTKKLDLRIERLLQLTLEARKVLSVGYAA